MAGKISKDLTGNKYGMLTVIGRSPDNGHGKKPCVKWLCQCECGRITQASKWSLENGLTVSCGCRKKIHGEKHTRLYQTWQNMKRRCHDPKNKRYEHYGLRGITVCQDWDKNYLSFRDWALSSGYKEGLTIERIDVNGNYCPDNCKWLPMSKQADNTTRSVYYLFYGKKMTIRQISDETGLTYSTISHRVQRNQPVNGVYLRRCN